MSACQSWRLTRYGRFVPGSTGEQPWKIFEAKDNKPGIFLTIVGSGYLLGESRMSRMQFGGRCRAEAIKECSSALEKLQEYTSVSTHDDTPSPAKPPPPAEASAPVIQQTGRGKAVEVDAEGSLSIRSLTQHILGETVVSLPRVYHQGSLVQVDFEPILRVCLLDPSFPAFVEEMEGELEKLLEE